MPLLSNKFSTVFLDVDGTLVDSNLLHAEAWLDCLKKFGYSPSFSQMLRCIGMGGDKIIPLLTGLDKNESKAKKIAALRKKIYLRDYVKKVVPFPKTQELLMRLNDMGYELLTTSSADPEELAETLKVAHLENLLLKPPPQKNIKSKPDPDVLVAAAHAFDINFSRTIMIGDTPYDVTAANTLSIPVICFLTGIWTPEDLHKAVAFYADAEDLLLHLDASPLALAS